MIFRSSSVGSPVTFGRMMCGKPKMSSSGVDASMVGVSTAGYVPCCG
jgi:hypothetical protein